MKKFTYVLFFGTTLCWLFPSCTHTNESNVATQIAEIESKYQDTIKALRQELCEANDKIEILSFPADQRLTRIGELFNSGDYAGVKKEAAELKRVFPNAKENDSSNEYLKKIEAIETAKKAEEERIKALGFKAIAQRTSFQIGYNKVTISGINVGNIFTFDDYGSSYFYRTADRGSKYVSMSMTITSTDHDPNLPQLALYSINAGKMTLQGKFQTEFARWSDYGAYLGNYHDTRNDFAKVSTVRFKLGLQIEDEILQKPYAIVAKKENALTLSYERFENPPYSYIGSVSYPSTLEVSDFTEQYFLVKLTNLK